MDWGAFAMKQAIKFSEESKDLEAVAFTWFW